MNVCVDWRSIIGYNDARVIGMPRTPRKLKPLVDRFWDKVDKRGLDECWPWTGSHNTSGYGEINRGLRGKGNILAHRASWEIHNGPIPEGKGWHGMCVLHHCDNPECVNPAHLFLGTQADNMRDMHVKNRRSYDTAARGENHGNAKLTNQDVREILCLLKAHYTQKEIAIWYGVVRQTISMINIGMSWGWLKEEVGNV
jgi:hypothetical protein